MTTAPASVDPRVLAARLGAVVELLAIQLVKLTAERFDGDFEPAFVTNLTVQLSAIREPAEQITFQAIVGVEVVDGGQLPVTTLSCSYVVAYQVPADFEIHEEMIRAFGEVTVTFMLYPYLRELVNNITSRMGLPAFTLGALKRPLTLHEETPRTD